jgi:hypothetical protein
MHLPFSEDFKKVYRAKNAKRAKKEIYLFFRNLAPFAPLRETLFSDLFPTQSHSPIHGEST